MHEFLSLEFLRENYAKIVINSLKSAKKEVVTRSRLYNLLLKKQWSTTAAADQNKVLIITQNI